jgi:hypothetical protein
MSQQNATSTQPNNASPTGAPVVPPAAVPWLVGLVGLAAVGAQTLPRTRSLRRCAPASLPSAASSASPPRACAASSA